MRSSRRAARRPGADRTSSSARRIFRTSARCRAMPCSMSSSEKTCPPTVRRVRSKKPSTWRRLSACASSTASRSTAALKTLIQNALCAGADPPKLKGAESLQTRGEARSLGGNGEAGEVAAAPAASKLRFHRLERLGKLLVHGVQNSARREAWRAHGAQSARKRRSTSGSGSAPSPGADGTGSSPPRGARRSP